MFAQHVMKLLLFACALVSCCAGQLATNEELATDGQLTTNAEVPSNCQLTATNEPGMSLGHETLPFLKITTTMSTPAAVFIGKHSNLVRCLQKNPAQCEIFHASGPNSIVAHMEYVYVPKYEGILRCKSTTRNSCKFILKTSDVGVLSVAFGDGKIFAGLENGTLLVSELHQTSGFRTLHTFSGRQIYTLKKMDGWLYAGLDNGHLMRCSTTEDNACTLRYDMKTYITGLVNISDTIIGVTWDGHLWNCSHKNEFNDCVSVALNFNSVRAVTVFNGDLYVLKDKVGIYKCIWGNDFLCCKYATSKHAMAVAFVYGTHLLLPQYRNENKACTWQRHSKCPPYVTYYNTQQRAALQVHVKDGKLYNSEGALVDTRDADEGHSGPAAIFAMSPDGTILLSNTHNGMFHISSLFAGSPVSGAGEMIVVDGVIRRMMACSDHYLPNLNLNKQVIQSLASQGYTEPIKSVSCL